MDSIFELKQYYADLDELYPYKLVTGKGKAQRFSNEEHAKAAYEKVTGRALLTFNEPYKEQKTISIKYD